MSHFSPLATTIGLLALVLLPALCPNSSIAASNPPKLTNSIGMQFVLIPAGSVTWTGYTRISPGEDRLVTSTATISKPYYLGGHEVTQEQWHEIMGDNPACFKGSHNPVECVSWHDVQVFIHRLNQKEGHTRYRLPTEAEWEHAARAGTSTEYFFGDDEGSLDLYAWYRNNSDGKTHPVGQKKPNPWGLYDLYGNVWEWVQDRYADYPPTDVTDYAGPAMGDFRVTRGGGLDELAPYCHSGSLNWGHPDFRYYDLGFRLALSPAE